MVMKEKVIKTSKGVYKINGEITSAQYVNKPAEYFMFTLISPAVFGVSVNVSPTVENPFGGVFIPCEDIGEVEYVINQVGCILLN